MESFMSDDLHLPTEIMHEKAVDPQKLRVERWNRL
jgi:hypothetical protein